MAKKVAIAKSQWENAKKGVGRHASFPSRKSVKASSKKTIKTEVEI